MPQRRRRSAKGGGGGGIVILLAVLVVVGYLAYVAWQKQQAQHAGVATENGTGLVSADGIVFGGEPRARAGAGGEVAFEELKNDAYVAGYSEALRDPLWVAYHVKNNPQALHLDRPKKFSPDTRTRAPVKESDFTRSGYQRGHMAPNEAIMESFGGEAQLQTFLLSNICPQAPELNEHVWERLEKDERDYAKRDGEVWVIDGPIFGDLNGGRTERLASGIAVPMAFYKIVMDETSGGKVRVFSVIMPQDVKGTELPQQFLTSVSTIENETHLEFLWKLDTAARAELENKVWPMWNPN